jgi:hypothetical protein
MQHEREAGEAPAWDSESYRSPLWLVTREPSLNQLVGYLSEMKSRIETAPEGPHRFVFTRNNLEEVRAAFARMIRLGESQLHGLCALLSDALCPSSCELNSVVVGEVETTRERFILSQTLSMEELLAITDLDLGNRQLQKLRFHDGTDFRRALLVANFVEYQPFEVGTPAVYKLSSRIKAEEEIWNKVVDEIFHLDGLIQRDKKLRELSRYVKDIFGLKVIASDARTSQLVQAKLMELEWTEAQLAYRGFSLDDSTRRLKFLEVKDYLNASDRKQSGWSAIKSVVRWSGHMFEIQVQPLKNYLSERERLTQESHSGFKMRREDVRNQVAEAIPLFRFYRDLLQWLFRAPSDAPPSFAGVEIELRA